MFPLHHNLDFFVPPTPLQSTFVVTATDKSPKCPFCPPYRWAPRVNLLLPRSMAMEAIDELHCCSCTEGKGAHLRQRLASSSTGWCAWASSLSTFLERSRGGRVQPSSACLNSSSVAVPSSTSAAKVEINKNQEEERCREQEEDRGLATLDICRGHSCGQRAFSCSFFFFSGEQPPWLASFFLPLLHSCATPDLLRRPRPHVPSPCDPCQHHRRSRAPPRLPMVASRPRSMTLRGFMLLF